MKPQQIMDQPLYITRHCFTYFVNVWNRDILCNWTKW